MRAAVVGNRKLQLADNGSAIRGGQLNRQNIGDRTILIPAAGKGIAAAHHQVTSAAVTDKVDDHLELILREESGFDAAEDQTFVTEQLLAFGRKTLGEHFFLVDALTIKLVLRGA